MEQVSVTLYDFTELPSDVQDKVIENHRGRNVDDQFWHEHILDDWKEKLEALGFNNPDISYTGFWSQGDGACFTCDSIDLEKYTEYLIMQADSYEQAKWLRVFGLLYDKGLANAKINHVGRYYHEHSMSVEYEVFVQSEAVYQRFNGLMDHIEQAIVKISQAIYRELEAEHNYLTEDDAVKDSLMASELQFRDDGRVWA